MNGSHYRTSRKGKMKVIIKVGTQDSCKNQGIYMTGNGHSYDLSVRLRVVPSVTSFRSLVTKCSRPEFPFRSVMFATSL